MFIPEQRRALPPPEALEESNLVTSWVKRFFTGVDPGAAEAIRKEIGRGIRTPAHRRQVIHYIDELIAKAQHAEDGSAASDAADGALWVGVPAFVLAAAAGGTTFGGAAAAGVAAAAKARFTSRNRISGEIRRYIESLREVRREVEAAGLSEAAAAEGSQLEEALLCEGLGGLAKHLAVGDIEGQIGRLRSEADDVESPAAQAMVLRKVVALMQRLTQLRHGRAGLARFVHDSAAWFERHVEGRNAVTEIDIRAGEALHDLAAVRDKLMSKRWDSLSPAQNDERLAGLRKAAAESLARVAHRQEEYEF